MGTIGGGVDSSFGEVLAAVVFVPGDRIIEERARDDILVAVTIDITLFPEPGAPVRWRLPLS